MGDPGVMNAARIARAAVATGVSSPKLCQKPSGDGRQRQTAATASALRASARRTAPDRAVRAGSDMCTNLPLRSARRHRAAAIGAHAGHQPSTAAPSGSTVTATSSKVTKRQHRRGTRRLGISAACPTGEATECTSRPGIRQHSPAADVVRRREAGHLPHWGLY